MGSYSGDLDEQPTQIVTISRSFYMDIYEVTNAQYAACVAAGICGMIWDRDVYTGRRYYGDPLYDSYPVVMVSWYDANEYCAWRGGRLPTEAEWEYAAHGGLEGKYPWGDTWDGSQANFCDANCRFDHRDSSFNDGYADKAPVGSYAPNGYGLYDMAGNVWEWVADEYGRYPGGSVVDPTGPSGLREARVLRGGSYLDIAYSLRVTQRKYRAPGYDWNTHVGFRCVALPGK